MESTSTGSYVAIAFGTSATLIALLGWWDNRRYQRRRDREERLPLPMAPTLPLTTQDDVRMTRQARELKLLHIVQLLCSERINRGQNWSIGPTETVRDWIDLDAAKMGYEQV